MELKWWNILTHCTIVSEWHNLCCNQINFSPSSWHLCNKFKSGEVLIVSSVLQALVSVFKISFCQCLGFLLAGNQKKWPEPCRHTGTFVPLHDNLKANKEHTCQNCLLGKNHPISSVHFSLLQGDSGIK